MKYHKYLEDTVKITNESNTIRIVGEVGSRKSVIEVSNLLFEIDDYVAIEKENRKE